MLTRHPVDKLSESFQGRQKKTMIFKPQTKNRYIANSTAFGRMDPIYQRFKYTTGRIVVSLFWDNIILHAQEKSEEMCSCHEYIFHCSEKFVAFLKAV